MMDDTVGNFSYSNQTVGADYEGVAKRAALLAVHLEVHETGILHNPDVTSWVSNLPSSMRIEVLWNEERAFETFYLQHETNSLVLFGRIKKMLERYLVPTE